MTTQDIARLPEHGIALPELERMLADAGRDDVDWRNGRVPMFIHFAGDDVLEVAKKAYLMYFSENGLGPRAFGSLAKFEREVVQMGLGLLHGDAQARGAMTTGGTESIFLAVKCARDRALQKRPGMGKPRIVMPHSAHPAFDKAAHFLGLEAVRTPLGEDLCADVAAMRAAITPDTAMLVGSAPSYPHGVVDPIPAIAALAREHGLWMHVDACVGGYFAPFARELGADIPDFDFKVEGVTSISADLHKYGYTAKGASTLFFADPESFALMGYYFDDWPRGQYFTHTLVGTRPGGAIAAAWAVMNYLGHEGYLRVAARVIATRRAMQAGLDPLGMHTFGRPELSIFAFGSPERDMAAVGKGMSARGWTVGYSNVPPGIHHMLNLTHEPVVGQYLADMKAVLADPSTKASAGSGRIDAVY
ncbi:aspartate aminotransferase family protein [Variovorax sp.]|uniref:pyridoxal phosphate-dependent decarboxylase family protein n=1 Tax=Variovorax sp. TaxID=1871043 RepID=UPI002D55EF5C|nr:aspartate aminotransferase family protein [Variovorax sp.]HYP84991.1 aspartate aminotransferase family protein [Variovorax sp.]